MNENIDKCNNMAFFSYFLALSKRFFLFFFFVSCLFDTKPHCKQQIFIYHFGKKQFSEFKILIINYLTLY